MQKPMHNSGKTISEYINSLPSDRREAVSKVRSTILKHLPEGFEETMQYDMIAYVVPLKLYPAGYLYDRHIPIPYAYLSSQKNYLALYLMAIDGNQDLETWFRNAWKKSGHNLDMKESCVRLKQIQDIPFQVIAEAIAKCSIEEFINLYEKSHPPRKKGH
jgi:hypothetical protein